MCETENVVGQTDRRVVNSNVQLYIVVTMSLKIPAKQKIIAGIYSLYNDVNMQTYDFCENGKYFNLNARL